MNLQGRTGRAAEDLLDYGVSEHKASLRCEDRNYIHLWLDEVDKDPSVVGEALDEEPSWRPHDLAVHQKTPSPDTEAGKRHSCILRDSPPLTPKRHQGEHSPCNEPSDCTRPKSSSDQENRYAKRARRKTKVDRYVSNKPLGNKSSMPKTARDKRARKKKLRSGKEVIHNFTSNKISKDRVTIKPNFTAGLFSNARGSAPVTDLTFNDMGFLSRQDHYKNHEHRKSPTKEKTKISRDLRGEADFFARNTRRRRQAGSLQPSGVSRATGSRLPKVSKGARAPQSSELEGLKLPNGRKNHLSEGLQERSELNSQPPATSPEGRSISWSTSPDSACRRTREPAAPTKRPSTSSSALRPSVIERLVRTGVFDFAGKSKLSEPKSRPCSRHALEGEGNTVPKRYLRDDTGVVNRVCPQDAQRRKAERNGTVLPSKKAKESDTEQCDMHDAHGGPSMVPSRARTQDWRFEDDKNLHADRGALTSHQTHSNALQSPQALGCREHWDGPRLPHLMPSPAEISREISESQDLGQYWPRIDPMHYANFFLHNDSERTSRTRQSSVPQFMKSPAHASAGGERMADFIARLEAEVLGEQDDNCCQYEATSYEPYHDQPADLIDGYRPEQPQNLRTDALYPRHNEFDIEGYDESEMTSFWRPNRFL